MDRCFDSLLRIKFSASEFEVIFVDNGSIDGSLEFIQKNYPSTKTITLQHNFGFGEGNNQGAKIARGRLLVFLNNDTQVTEDWLSTLFNIAEANPDAILTCKSLLMDYPDKIDFDGSQIRLTYLGTGILNNFGDADYGDFHHYEIIQPYGSCMVLSKELFFELGMFDSEYFAASEDLDLGLRAWLFGYRVVYTPLAVFYHKLGGTTGKPSSDTRIRYGTRNAFSNIVKYFDTYHLIVGLFVTFIYNIFEALLLVQQRRIQSFRVKVSAIYWTISSFRYVYRKRLTLGKRVRKPRSILFSENFFSPIEKSFRHYFYNRRAQSNFFGKAK